MADHNLPGGRRPARTPHPIALTVLVAASALGTFRLVSPIAPTEAPAARPDPIALWLDTGPRHPAAAITEVARAEAPEMSAQGGERPAAPGPEGAVLATADAAVATTAPHAGADPRPGPAAPPSGDPVATGVPPPEVERRADTPAPATAQTEAPSAAPTSVQTEAPPASSAPGPSAPEQAAAVAATREKGESAHALPSRWRDHKVKKGETLGQVLKTFGVDKGDRAKVLAAAKGNPALTKLKVGQAIRGRVADDGGLLELQLRLDPKTSVHLELSDDDYRIHTIDRPVEKRLAQTSAVIQSSLFVDGQEAGLSDAQIMELAAIFGWDVDFALGLRAGDRFSLIYEAEYLDGQKVDDGTILAAEFVNQGRRHRAVRFEDDDGTLGYYAPDGTSKKQAFLRSPLKLARVSSNFSLSRQHPILNTRRAHKGVDYSAPVGTPVKATGSGLVTFTGQKNGYGNVIELQHGAEHSTLYAHLSRFADGLQVGEPVKQGEVIGYVGQTGLATGPHLHYEFRVAGEHRDPLTTKLPKIVPLEGPDLSIFRQKAAPLLAQLDRMERTMVARAP